MNEEHGIGAALRAAREEKGWTTQDVGSRLRLMARQIEAIEAEEFSRLGQPVFARGFVRNYAKLLGLNPDELLDQMTRIKTAPVQESENVPFKPGEEFWKSPWVLGGIAAAILLIAIPVGLYLWLNSGEEEASAPAAQQTVPPPAPPPAPLQPQPSALPATPPAAAQTSSQAPAPKAVQQSSVPATPQPVPVQPTQVSVPAPAPAALARPPLPFPVQAQAAQPATAAVVPASAKPTHLRLQFDEAAWVQVRDSSGALVHSALNQPGTSVEINGKAPFTLVVGNAAHVRVSYKGQPVDLKPYTDVTVARLTLNP
jgi:cytoskeleton protein RodZ